jgi:hypothetical protein
MLPIEIYRLWWTRSDRDISIVMVMLQYTVLSVVDTLQIVIYCIVNGGHDVDRYILSVVKMLQIEIYCQWRTRYRKKKVSGEYQNL